MIGVLLTNKVTLDIIMINDFIIDNFFVKINTFWQFFNGFEQNQIWVPAWTQQLKNILEIMIYVCDVEDNEFHLI